MRVLALFRASFPHLLPRFQGGKPGSGIPSESERVRGGSIVSHYDSPFSAISQAFPTRGGGLIVAAMPPERHPIVPFRRVVQVELV